jgi:hypothetical protein
VTRVTFTTTSGPVQLPNPDAVNTPPLASGGSQLVEFVIPPNCTGAVRGNCDFAIAVNVTDAGGELILTNNNASGTCGPGLF